MGKTEQILFCAAVVLWVFLFLLIPLGFECALSHALAMVLGMVLQGGTGCLKKVNHNGDDNETV